MEPTEISPAWRAYIESSFREVRVQTASEVVTALRSERRAWLVALTAIIFATVLACASLYAFSRDKPNGFLVTVDKASGETSTVLMMDKGSVAYGEALAKHNLHRYVLSCEQYVRAVLQFDYDTCMILSRGQVKSTYAAKFSGDKPQDSIEGQVWRIEIASIVLLGDDNQRATVNWKRIKKFANGQPDTIEKFVSSINYGFDTVNLQREKEWMLNPVSFGVTSYRTDPVFENKSLTTSAPPS